MLANSCRSSRSMEDCIVRIDVEMESVRQILVQWEREPEPSETENAVSRITTKTSKPGHYFSTPGSAGRSRTGSTVIAALQRGMSPLRKMVSRVSGSLGTSGKNTPSASAATSPSMSATATPPKPPPKSPYRAQSSTISLLAGATHIPPFSPKTRGWSLGEKIISFD